MGQTHKMEVLGTDGDVLRARVSIVSVDEVFMWISPAFFACQLHESTSGKSAAAKTRARLQDAGLFAEQDAEGDDAGLERLNGRAAAFITAVEIGPVIQGKVTAERPGAALNVARTERAKDPYVDVVLRMADPGLIAHLKVGDSWETATMGFGELPE